MPHIKRTTCCYTHQKIPGVQLATESLIFSSPFRVEFSNIFVGTVWIYLEFAFQSNIRQNEELTFEVPAIYYEKNHNLEFFFQKYIPCVCKLSMPGALSLKFSPIRSSCQNCAIKEIELQNLTSDHECCPKNNSQLR
jgi:hypothetical protein